jgi:hypothetical protein
MLEETLSGIKLTLMFLTRGDTATSTFAPYTCMCHGLQSSHTPGCKEAACARGCHKIVITLGC